MGLILPPGSAPMPDNIHRNAHLSVMRGCGFGLLGIVTGMMGLANDAVLALRWGGIGTLLMTFVLILKAARVDRVPYRSTEVWVMLDPHQRPPDALAGRLIAVARRDALLRYAYFSAGLSVALLAGELALITVFGR